MTRSLLVTGCSSIHVGRKLQVEYAVPNSVIVDLMAEAGWRVDKRPVVPGEDLGDYDRVLVYLMSPSAFPARFVLGALWALGSRPDAVVAVDDWQTRSCLSSWRRALVMNQIWKPLLQSVRPGWNESLTSAVKPVIEAAAHELAQEKLERDALWHAYASGDPDKLPFWRTKSKFTYDPTNFFRPRYAAHLGTSPRVENRSRSWVQASLLKKEGWLEKQKLTWPVHCYGNVKLGQPRVPELELLQVYASNWGVLSPSHGLAASGWWRIRYMMAALTKSVVHGDPRELQFFGPSFCHYSAADIEKLNETELKKLGEWQAEDYENQLWSLDLLRQRLVSFFENL